MNKFLNECFNSKENNIEAFQNIKKYFKKFGGNININLYSNISDGLYNYNLVSIELYDLEINKIDEFNIDNDENYFIFKEEENFLGNIKNMYGSSYINFDIDLFCNNILYSKKIKYDIKFTGKGGHSSLRYELNSPVNGICEFNVKINEYINTLENKNDLKLWFPYLKTSNASNIIPNTAIISGFVQSYNTNILLNINNKIKELTIDISEKYKYQYEINNQEINLKENQNKNFVKNLYDFNKQIFNKVKNKTIFIIYKNKLNLNNFEYCCIIMNNN